MPEEVKRARLCVCVPACVCACTTTVTGLTPLVVRRGNLPFLCVNYCLESLCSLFSTHVYTTCSSCSLHSPSHILLLLSLLPSLSPLAGRKSARLAPLCQHCLILSPKHLSNAGNLEMLKKHPCTSHWASIGSNGGTTNTSSNGF